MMNWIKRVWFGWDKPQPEPLAPRTSHSGLGGGVPLAPLTPPRMAQEQFGNASARSIHEAARQAALYRQVVGTNNRNVTRDMGGKVGVVTLAPSAKFADAATLTIGDIRELEELKVGVHFIAEDARKPELIPKPEFPVQVAMEPRRPRTQDEREHIREMLEVGDVSYVSDAEWEKAKLQEKMAATRLADAAASRVHLLSDYK